MKEIPLTQGKVALVDDEDYERLSKFKWCAQKKGNVWYAMRNSLRGELKKRKMISMHRFLMNTPEGMDTDHWDGNGLNNRVSNLRIVTRRENLQNLKNIKNKKTSCFPGVRFKKDNKCHPWEAGIYFCGVVKYVGCFSTEEEAYKEYKEFERCIDLGLPLPSTTYRKQKSNKYRGVYWKRRERKWISIIRFNGRGRRIGGFKSEEDAHVAFLVAEKFLFGSVWGDINFGN